MLKEGAINDFSLLLMQGL